MRQWDTSTFWKAGGQLLLSKRAVTIEGRSENHVPVVAVTKQKGTLRSADAEGTSLPDRLQPCTEGVIDEFPKDEVIQDVGLLKLHLRLVEKEATPSRIKNQRFFFPHFQKKRNRSNESEPTGAHIVFTHFWKYPPCETC